jgi:arginine utilization protein RocB
VRNDVAARAREIALTLAAWPSVTGSAEEEAFAGKLAGLLGHFDTAWTEPVPGDRRTNVFALKRGRGRRTIVLTGHFDVVPANDYGALEPFAFSPERLLPEAIARLRRTGENGLALADFESGEFLPGRGLLDMKAGLAAGIAAMEAYRGDASLLFLGVADEEERSAGARAAATLLRTWPKRMTWTLRSSSISMRSRIRAMAWRAASWRWAPLESNSSRRLSWARRRMPAIRRTAPTPPISAPNC